MAEYDQNININIGVETKKLKSGLESAKEQVRAAKESIEGLDESADTADVTIGGDIDEASITEAVTEAQTFAQLEVLASPDPTIPIGGEVSPSLMGEIKDLITLSEVAPEAAEGKNLVADANNNLGDSAKNSVKELDKENSSFKDIIDAGDSLTTVKEKVADANKHVAAMSKESARELGYEDDNVRNVLRSMGVLEEGLDEAGDSMKATDRALRKMRNSTDGVSDSMRAAAEVGDLFEDGLGSLSVNMGAFTIALRNFLTQVPLLLTALGSLGAAALGAAAGFTALAGAMAGIVAVGAIGHAQDLKQEYAGIEGLGQSLEVIMLNIKDAIFEALSPLLENKQAAEEFKNAIEGIAFVISALANSFNNILESDQFTEVKEVLKSDVMPAIEDLVGSFENAFYVLGETAARGTAIAIGGLADMVDFSVYLFDQIDDLRGLISSFGDTLSHLAVIGARIGGGLIPVFEAFTAIVDSIAKALMRMDSEMMQNAVTALALFAALNKVSGTLGSIVKIIPNVVTGMANISASASKASGVMATFRAVTAASALQLKHFLAQTSLLSGFLTLIVALTGTGEQMRKLAFDTKAASEVFEELAKDSDKAASELQELAVSGRLAEEQLEELNDSNIDIDTKDGKIAPRQFLPDSPIISAFLGSSVNDAVQEVGDSVEDSSSNISNQMKLGHISAEGVEIPNITQEAEESANKATKALNDKMSDNQLKKEMIHKGGILPASITDGDEVEGVTGKISKGFKKVGSSIKNLNFKSAIKGFGTLLAQMVALQVRGIKGAIVGLGKLAYVMTGQAAISRKTAISNAVAAASNFLLGGSAQFATTSMYALATSIVVATGGIAALVGIIGGLAVGIITNFKEIKSSASDVFGFLKKIVGIVADVLITYFITSWNLLVDAFQAVMAGLQPLINMFKDIGATLGIVGKKGKDSGGVMETIGNIANFVKDAIKLLGSVMSGLIDILGGVLWFASLLIKVALIPMLVTIEAITFAVDMLIGFFDDLVKKFLGVEGGVSGLIKMFKAMFSVFMDGLDRIPKLVEGVVNTVIDAINTIAGPVPGVDKIEKFELDKNEGAKTDREELGNDTSNMKDSMKGEGDKTITYNEDNSTNIDQTVNADPEDQAKLSRVVSDAIAEANSFERRRQGGQ